MADSSNGLRIELLGPVEAWVDGRPVALGGRLPRALFAVLALMGGRVVTIDQLIDELWGEEPPARARDSLQMHVSRLRKGLVEAGADGDRLVSRAGGYLLEVRPGERDVDRWQHALERARRARADGEPQVARQRVEEALAVWHGEPLAGVSMNSLLAAERARLEEERLAAIVEGVELDLELGRHGELLGELEALVIAHPFKERIVELQMLALYRSGRQADALAAFQVARGRFVDELGIEPAEQLRKLHEDVLQHSAELSSPVDQTARTKVEVQPRLAAPIALADRRLPVPPNRTIGREHEVVAIAERLRAGSVRLLTLTGPGGVGKTRLALEAARAVRCDFADGAHFVSLAALQQPQGVPAAIVEALGIMVLSGESADQAAERFLAAKHLLLVADNFEHLLAAAPFIGGLLGACPSLTVLATSREPLALHAEERYPVSPLALPDLGTPEDPKALAGTDAVALFCERARAHDPDFRLSTANANAVAEICRRVDGLPLAIELAAARCGLLAPREIAQRLDAAVGALGAGARDAPARQQTLRATLDWSHDLLSEPARTCFARFGVFAGGATVQASETITGADIDTLDDLVAKNLLVRHEHPHDETRLGMLETIHAYACERFAAAADREAVGERHYRHFLTLAERHATERALWSADRNEHLGQLDAERDNLHAALAWAVGEGSAGRALSMAAAIAEYWRMRSRPADAVSWIDQVLGQPGADAYPGLRVRLLTAKAMALWDLGRAAEQPAVWAEAEAVARALGDPVILSRALQARVSGEYLADRLDVAEALAEEALHWATTARDDWAIAMAAFGKAMAAATIADLRERTDRAASLLDEVGNVFHLATLLASAAYAAMGVGSDLDARELVERAIPIARRLDDPALWMRVHGDVGLAALLTGDVDAAGEAFREELRLGRELVVRPFTYEGLSGLAAVAATRDEPDRAARLAGAAGLGQRPALDANETPSVTVACCTGALRYGAPYAVIEDRLDATFFDTARTSCGLDAWNAAADEGAALGLDDAIAYALQEPHA
jgi:predicted ATPase/DNA-binding SARP family transcriptional activator